MDIFSWIALSIAVGAFVEVEVKNRKLEKRVEELEKRVKSIE